MMKINLLIMLIISLINGCTSIQNNPPEKNIAPVYERSVDPAYKSQEALVNEPPIIEEMQQPKVITTAALERANPSRLKKQSPPASRQAVLDLLAQSKSAMDENNYAVAEGLLKRAIRIEPSNAWLWHNMAVLKFYQKDYHQAIQQALKSNNLEKNNQELKSNNTKVIKQSYIELEK